MRDVREETKKERAERNEDAEETQRTKSHLDIEKSPGNKFLPFTPALRLTKQLKQELDILSFVEYENEQIELKYLALKSYSIPNLNRLVD